MPLVFEPIDESLLARLRRWRPSRRQVVWALGPIALAIVLFLFTRRDYGCDWTGLGTCPTLAMAGQEVRPEKTLWDWLGLLLVPGVLVGVGLWFSQQEKRNEQAIAAKRAEGERQIADDNQREAALQAYLDRMADLLLESNLRRSKPEDEVRAVARARTLTVLRRLDAERKGTVVRFLYESDLIGQGKAIVHLAEANLGGADLAHANLEGADFEGADLSSANIRFANLKDTNFSSATLTGANLRGSSLHRANFLRAVLAQTNFQGAILSGANLVTTHVQAANFKDADLQNSDLAEADFGDADLRGANLLKANLQGINLWRADLQGADLQGADLRGAGFDDADLRGANLTDANLAGTNLAGANLAGANMTGANLEHARVHSTFYSKTTIWPVNLTDPQSRGAILDDDDVA